MQYILLVEQKNGKLRPDSHEVTGPQVLEIGAEARLKTYLNGLTKGLQLADFRRNVGFAGRIVMVRNSDNFRYEFFILSTPEWKEYGEE